MKHRSHPRPSFVRLLFVCLPLLCALSVARAGELGRTMRFEIPAQLLSPALLQFSGQTSIQVITRAEDVSKLKTRGVSGRMSVEAALKKLLEGTGFSYTVVGETTVEIGTRAVTDKAAPAAEARADAFTPAGLRLAQVEPRGKSEDKEPSADEQDIRGVPEILVQGQRSMNTDIARTRDDPQPYVVFDKEEIRRSQATTLEDFFRTRLPQNTSPASYGQQVGAALPYSNINLRGLGTNQTLVLVDGRRLAGVANIGDFGQPDVNGIPLSAIERIEVLPSTAGGIYGGGATGGVVNIVMRRDFRGGEVKADYGNTFDKDAGSVRVEASGGFSLEGGRTQIMLSASRSESNRLLMGDRDFARKGLELQLRNNPALITANDVPPLGFTTNIWSTQGPLTLDPQYGGTSIGSAITHLPLGYTGPASDQGAGLVANAGNFDYRLSNDMKGTQNGLLSAPAIESASLNVRRQFTSRFEAFAEVSSLESRRDSVGNANVINSVTLPGDAPTNYFQQTVKIRFPSPNLVLPIRGKSTTVRATGGLIFHLPKSWTAEADYNWSTSRFGSVSTSQPLHAAASDVLKTGLPSGDFPVLNALQETNTAPLDFAPFLLPSPNRFNGPHDTALKDTTLRLSGPVLALPGGQLNLSVLAERRDEIARVSFSESLNSRTLLPSLFYSPERSQSVDSLYLEARAPLLKSIELQASVRRDRYGLHSDGGDGYLVPTRAGPFPELMYTDSTLSSTDYTLGARYAPTEDVAFRASIGTGFLPPSILQISASTDEYEFEYGPDPLRGETDIYTGSPYTVISGGNPDLKPEASESFSAGIVLTPRFIPGARLSIDYTRIEKTAEIQYPDYRFLLLNASLFPGRVARGPNLDTDEPGWAGPITLIDMSLLNVARSTVESYDIQADYAVSSEHGRGDFRWYAMATWQPHYRNQVAPGSAPQEYIGYADGPLEWRGNLGLSWDRGPLSVGWNMQYYDSYLVYGTYALSDPGYLEDVVLSQGSDTIPSQIYHDLIASYRIGSVAGRGLGWLAGSELSVGVQNVFNKSPPIMAITEVGFTAGYSTYGDPRLRRYSLSLRKSFQ